MSVVAAYAALAAAAQSSAQPVEAYTRLPAFEGVEISAEGRWLAAPCPTAESQRICVYDLEQGGQPLTVPFTDGIALTDFYFAGENHLLVRTGFTESLMSGSGRQTYPIDRAVVVDVRTAESAALMSNEQWSTSNAGVVSIDRSNPETVLVEMTFLRGSGIQTGTKFERAAEYVNQLYRVSLDDGRGRRIATDDSLYRVVNADGNVAARVFHDIESGLFQVRSGDRRGEVLYAAQHSYERPSIPGFIDETGLAFVTETASGRGVLRLDLQSGEISDPFGFADQPYQRPLFDRNNRLWGFVAREDGVLVQRIVDEGLARDRRALSDVMGTPVAIETFTEDRSEVVFSTSSPGAPARYFIFERAKSEVGMLGAAYPELAEAPLPPRFMISYEASDGLTIPAVLTTPQGLGEGQAAPLVVMPHGGPAARDGLEFDWWAQALAAQGYVVLQPNFRGSDGYGRAFREAGFGEFGGRMIEDILDGARHLQSEGIAQPGGFCLTGGSYGGYAALMGAVRAPEEVACVVAFAPVTEPMSLLGRASDEGGENALHFWEEYIGSRFQDRESAGLISVLDQAGALSMPVIVLHGDIDSVVPVDQSRQLALAMEGRSAFEYVELENETHYFDLPATRALIVERSLDLFDRTLDDPAP